MSDNIDAIEINTCGQLDRPDMSLLFMSKSRFCYHVSGQSSSAHEIASFLILMNNIHKIWSHDR